MPALVAALRHQEDQQAYQINPPEFGTVNLFRFTIRTFHWSISNQFEIKFPGITTRLQARLF